jgi:FdhD protein
MSKTLKVPVTRFDSTGQQSGEDEIACETPFTLFLNGTELLTTLCSPVDLDYLAAGILESEGLISCPGDILSMKIEEGGKAAHVEIASAVDSPQNPVFKPLIASGGGKGSSSYDLRRQMKGVCDAGLTVSTGRIVELLENFLRRSSAYNNTHGVHSAALCDRRGIVLFQDDIGRHNALDKIFGECLVKAIPLNEGIILTSGRISSEVLLKVARRRVPVLVSKAAPTDLGASLAQDTGITLLRVTKQGSVIAYSHPERIIHCDRNDA